MRSPSPAKTTSQAVAQPASVKAIVAVLAFWFASCAIFNHLTPQMVGALKKATQNHGTIDVTAIELVITVAIASTKLAAEGQRIFPPTRTCQLQLMVRGANRVDWEVVAICTTSQSTSNPLILENHAAS